MTTAAFALSPVCVLRKARAPGREAASSPAFPSPAQPHQGAALAHRRVRELMYGAGGAFRGLTSHWSSGGAHFHWGGGSGRGGGSGGEGQGDDEFNVDPSWGVAPGAHMILRDRADAVYAAAVLNLVQMSQALPNPATLVGDPSVPVVVLLSWMGAQQKHLKKYAAFYEDMGCEVHLFLNGLASAMLPTASNEQAQRVEKFIASQPAERPVFVHAFSIGTGIYGLLLHRLRDDLERLESFKQRVAGVVFDSGPAPIFPHDVAKGLHTVCPMISKAIWEPVANAFFAVTRARRSFGASEEALRSQQFPSPQLYFYSLDDKVIPNMHNAVEDFMEKNRRLGVEVYNKFWKNSVHASHLRLHQEEYLANLDQFFKRCMQLRSAKALEAAS